MTRLCGSKIARFARSLSQKDLRDIFAEHFDFHVTAQEERSLVGHEAAQSHGKGKCKHARFNINFGNSTHVHFLGPWCRLTHSYRRTCSSWESIWMLTCRKLSFSLLHCMQRMRHLVRHLPSWWCTEHDFVHFRNSGAKMLAAAWKISRQIHRRNVPPHSCGTKVSTSCRMFFLVITLLCPPCDGCKFVFEKEGSSNQRKNDDVDIADVINIFSVVALNVVLHRFPAQGCAAPCQSRWVPSQQKFR